MASSLANDFTSVGSGGDQQLKNDGITSTAVVIESGTLSSSTGFILSCP